MQTTLLGFRTKKIRHSEPQVGKEEMMRLLGSGMG